MFAGGVGLVFPVNERRDKALRVRKFGSGIASPKSWEQRRTAPLGLTTAAAAARRAVYYSETATTTSARRGVS